MAEKKEWIRVYMDKDDMLNMLRERLLKWTTTMEDANGVDRESNMLIMMKKEIFIL